MGSPVSSPRGVGVMVVWFVLLFKLGLGRVEGLCPREAQAARSSSFSIISRCLLSSLQVLHMTCAELHWPSTSLEQLPVLCTLVTHCLHTASALV